MGVQGLESGLMKLSAVVITKNEEKNLGECLAGLAFADEIVMVDSGSADRTLDIAKHYTGKVHTRAFDNFGAQKNFAAAQSSGEWILSVDADERVTAALAEEIACVLRSESECRAFRIPRKTYFLGKRLHFSGTQTDHPVRLFRRGSGQFEQPIHEFYRCDGPVGDLQHSLLHYTTPTVAVEIAKTEFYTELEAGFLKSRGVKPWVWHAVKPLFVFANLYLLKLGFLDGLAGFQFAFFSALYSRRKYQKLKELIRRETLEPKIQLRFDDFAKTLPDCIDRSDSRLNALLEACAPVKGKRVLEVGCGKGRFAKVFMEEGALLTGIDPSGVLLEGARRHRDGTFLRSSVSQLPFEDEKFDIVYVVEVIGHLPVLEKSVQEMFRVLKKGGTLVIVDRNKFSMSQKRFLAPNFLVKRWHELKNHWIYPMGFPFREKWFSKRGLTRMLEKYCEKVESAYIESDGEKICSWHVIFDRIPLMRVFILWKGIKK